MSSQPTVRLHDRRRSVRVEVSDEVNVRVDARPSTAKLLGISTSGLSIETPESFKVGVSYLLEVQFTDSPIRQFAECIRCARSQSSTEPMFEAGFVFEGLDSQTREIVRAFVGERARRRAG